MRFVSGDQTLDAVAAFLSSEKTEIALAVAFWGGDALKRLRAAEWKAKKVRVICDALSGACNPQALKDLKKQIGPDLRTNARLHAKVYWTPNKVVITSANASASGLSLEDGEVDGNIEAGVESTSEDLLIAAKRWFDALFESEGTEEVDDDVIAQAEQMWKTRRHGRDVADQLGNSSATAVPAQLLAPVEGHWIERAVESFRQGRESVYFGTNSSLIDIHHLPSRIFTVLFKPKGTTDITAKAKFIEIAKYRPVADEPLVGSEGEREDYNLYYAFKELEKLPKPIPLSSLRRYNSGKVVRNDVPGCCFVKLVTNEAR
jgi:PLD-like domain